MKNVCRACRRGPESLPVWRGSADLAAQGAAEPYKLGMFQQGDRHVRRAGPREDTTGRSICRRAGVTAPATLKELIAGWDARDGARGSPQIAADAAKQAPAYALQVIGREDAAADHRSVGACSTPP